MGDVRLTRRELQDLAKANKIKANIKSAEILRQLREKGIIDGGDAKVQAKKVSKSRSKRVLATDTLVIIQNHSPRKVRKKTRKKATPVPAQAQDPKLKSVLGRILPSFRDITKHFALIRQLGQEGKDGLTVLGQSKTDGSLHALKIFKKNKSVRNIQKEVIYQQKAASYGLAPAITSSWTISASRRCFAMRKLDRTLEQVVRDQQGEITGAQAKQILNLYRRLSELKILHNDENIGKNIMVDDSTGKFFLIDFGFAEEVKAADIKKYGIYPNYTLLWKVDSMQKAYNVPEHKLAMLRYVKEYEKRNNVIVDVRRHLREKLAERKKRMNQRLLNR